MINKRVFTVAIAALFVFSALVAFIPANESEGADPEWMPEAAVMEPGDAFYSITEPGHLVWMQLAEVSPGTEFRLMKDLDLSEKMFPASIIGAHAFTHTFNGNGFSITGLKIESSGEAGLFKNIGIGGLVEDLTLKNPIVSSTGNNVGGIASESSGAIKKCAVIGGTITGNIAVGGIVGHVLDRGSLSECYNTSTVKGGSNWIGGIVGQYYSSMPVTKCFNMGSVSGEAIVAGIIGLNYNAANVTYCYNSGVISGTNPTAGMISGIVGNNYSTGTISNVYNIGTLTGSRQTDICGQNLKGTIESAYWLAATANDKGGRTAVQMSGNGALGEMPGFDRLVWKTMDNAGEPYYAPQLIVFTASGVSDQTVAISLESVKITSGGSGGGSQEGPGGSGEPEGPGGTGGDNPDDGGDNTMLYIGVAAVAVVAVIGLLWFFVLKP